MSRLIWTKTETRQVRPFFTVADYESCLRNSEIQVFEGQAFSTQEAYVLQAEELARVSLNLRPNLVLPDIGEGALKREDLQFAVALSSPTLKKTRVVYQGSLDQEIPELITIDPDEVRCLGGASNLAIKLGVFLKRQLDPMAGRPFMKGHWVARKTFRIRPAKEANQFDVQSRTDAEWIEHGYPEKTLFAVEYVAGMNEAAQRDAVVGHVWVHEDVFNRVALDPDSKKSRAIMSMLSAEITVQLILQSYQDWKDADLITANSPLAAVVKQLSGSVALDLSRLKSMIEVPGQPKLRALIYNQQMTVRALVEA